MATYTIKAVLGSEDGSFTNKKNGEYVSLTNYHLTVNNGERDGNVWLSQKPETPAPTVGQTIDGHTETIPGGPHQGEKKLKKEQQGGGNFSGGGGGGSKGGGDSESIERQVAAYCTASILNGAVQSGKLELGSVEGYVGALTRAFAQAIRPASIEEANVANAAQQFNATPEPAAQGGEGDDIPF